MTSIPAVKGSRTFHVNERQTSSLISTYTLDGEIIGRVFANEHGYTAIPQGGRRGMTLVCDTHEAALDRVLAAHHLRRVDGAC